MYVPIRVHLCPEEDQSILVEMCRQGFQPVSSWYGRTLYHLDVQLLYITCTPLCTTQCHVIVD